MAKIPLGDFDFALLDSPDFKEDSVREEIVLPILKALGYSSSRKNQIIRSRSLIHPVVSIGSKRRKITVIPDYLLTIDDKPAWILDAKSPNEPITSGDNTEQVYSYAIHPEVRVPIYALCNGREFVALRVDSLNPILYFSTSEIAKHWQRLVDTLGVKAIQPETIIKVPPVIREGPDFDYRTTMPLAEIKNPDKQSAKRHFGVHGYFTKQAWNVVREYIKNFTRPGDIVLDPFGGTGVTFVEALMLGRKAIHVDINPHSIFIVRNLVSPVSISKLSAEFERIESQFRQFAPKTDQEIRRALRTYPYPKDIQLPKNSDVGTVEELFSPMQLAQLTYLKHLIKQVEDPEIRGVLLLMFSGLLNKINLTYHASSGRSEGRGDSAVYRYYRYRLAPTPATLDIMSYFRLRLKKVIAAKRELAPFLTADA